MSKQLTTYLTRAQKFSLTGLFLVTSVIFFLLLYLYQLTTGFLYSIPTFLIYSSPGSSSSYYLYPLCLLSMFIGLTVKNQVSSPSTKYGFFNSDNN